MPITVTGFSCETQRHSLAPETQFAGRVVRIMEQAETRNVSGTLDYTDNQYLTAVYALVWLGEHGVPPQDRHGRPVAYHKQYRSDVSRDLLPHEQFAWIDCTNEMTWRGADILCPSVDDVLEAGAVAALPVWEAEQCRLADERAAKAEEVRRRMAEGSRKVAERAAAWEAKKAAKLADSRVTADDEAARLPAKGSRVTLGNVTGTLFWIGVKAYRGKYSCRVGVKDASGNVTWGNAREVLTAR